MLGTEPRASQVPDGCGTYKRQSGSPYIFLVAFYPGVGFSSGFLSVSMVSNTSYDFKTVPGPPPQSRDSPAGMTQGIIVQGRLSWAQHGRNFWKLHKAVCFWPLKWLLVVPLGRIF